MWTSAPSLTVKEHRTPSIHSHVCVRGVLLEIWEVRARYGVGGNHRNKEPSILWGLFLFHWPHDVPASFHSWLFSLFTSPFIRLQAGEAWGCLVREQFSVFGGSSGLRGETGSILSVYFLRRVARENTGHQLIWISGEQHITFFKYKYIPQISWGTLIQKIHLCVPVGNLI